MSKALVLPVRRPWPLTIRHLDRRRPKVLQRSARVMFTIPNTPQTQR